MKIYDITSYKEGFLFKADTASEEFLSLDIRLVDVYNDKAPTTFFKIRTRVKYKAEREQEYWKLDITEVWRLLDMVFDKPQIIEFWYTGADENGKEAVELEEEFQFEYERILGTKIISRKTFGMRFEYVRQDEIRCGEIGFAEGVLKLHVERPENTQQFTLLFCKRYSIESSVSVCCHQYEDLDGSILSIPICKFENDGNEYRVVYDVYCRFRMGHGTYRQELAWGTVEKTEYKFEYGGCVYKLYSNIHGQLSILKTRIIDSMYVDEISMDKGVYRFGVQDCQLVMWECGKKGNKKALNRFETIGDKEIRFEDLCCQVHKDRRYQFMVLKGEMLYQLKCRAEFDAEGDSIKGWQWRVSCSEEGIFFSCTKKVRQIKIATWGSCYLRMMFRSEYNQNWKDYFEIVDNYFWPSVFSIVSKPVSPQYRYIKNGQENQKNVDREFLKTAVSDLEKSGAQYLLIDFFADAVHGARAFEEGSFVGQGPAFSPNSALMSEYENQIQVNSRIIDFQMEGYLELWKQKCKVFCGMLRDIGFGNKVILVKGTFNVIFCNGKEIRNLNHERVRGALIERDILEAKRSIWNAMDDYFISLMPETMVLDICSYHYFADLESSQLGPHHFEANYYRTLFAELCRQIFTYAE